MSDFRILNNSYGPEVIPYEATQQPPLMHYTPIQPYWQGIEKAADERPQETAPEALEPKKKGGKILGLSVATFWIIIVVLLLVVLGLGIGVGVGVGIRHGNGSSSRPDIQDADEKQPPTQTDSMSSADSRSETSTSTATASAVTSGTTGLADNSCTFSTPKTYHASDGTGFTQYCYTDWPNNSNAADGRGNVTDLYRKIVYTFEDCMEECLKYNDENGELKCRAITYNANLTSIVDVGQQGGNCFLKNKKGLDYQGSAESACAAIAL